MSTTTINNTNAIIFLRQLDPTSSIDYQVNSIIGEWTPITVYPITIINTNDTSLNTLLITLTSDITINHTSKYFILNSGNIEFDGNTYNINIVNVNNYPGLIFTSWFFENIKISNIHTKSDNSTLLNGAGWIGQDHFGYGHSNTIVEFCSSNGNIPDTGGGILGAYAGGGFGNLTVNNCFSIGNIENSAGGILGRFTSQNGGSVKLNSCYSTGNIGYNAGGIIGSLSSYSNNGICDASYCYSLGTIDTNGGGIYGINSGMGGLCYASNCYSTGNISEYAGGIFGANSAGIVKNCYTSGLATNIAYGFFGTNFTGGSLTNSLANGVNSGQWSDTNADTVLTEVGNMWIRPIPDNTTELTLIESPYLLGTFNKNFYNDVNKVLLFSGVNIYSNLTITAKGSDYILLKGNYSDNSYIFIENNGNKKGQIKSDIIVDTSDILIELLILNGSPINNSYYDYNIINVNLTITSSSGSESLSILDIYRISLSEDGRNFIGNDNDLIEFISDIITQDTFVSSDINLYIVQNAISYVTYTNLNPSLIDTEEYELTMGSYMDYILTTYIYLQRYIGLLELLKNSYDISKLDKAYQSKFLRMQYKASSILTRLLYLNKDLLEQLNNTKIVNSSQYPNIIKSINSVNILTKNINTSVSSQLANETDEAIISTTTKITNTISNEYKGKLQEETNLFQINNDITNETSTTIFNLYKDENNKQTTNINISSTSDNKPPENQTKIFSNVNLLFKGGTQYINSDITKDPDFVKYLMDLEYSVPENQANYIYEDNGLIKWFIEEEIVYNNVLDFFFQRRSNNNYMEALKYYLNTDKNTNDNIKNTIADIIQSNKITNSDRTLYGLSYNSFSDKKNNLTILQLCRMLQYTSGRLGYFNKHNVSYNYDYYISTPIYNSSSNIINITQLSIYIPSGNTLSLNSREDISIYYVILNNSGIIDSSSLINCTIIDSSSINTNIMFLKLSKMISIGPNAYLQCVVSNGNIYDVHINIPDLYKIVPQDNTLNSNIDIRNLNDVLLNWNLFNINDKFIDNNNNIYTIIGVSNNTIILDKQINTTIIVSEVYKWNNNKSSNIVAIQNYIDCYNFEEISYQHNDTNTNNFKNNIITNVVVINPIFLIDTTIYNSSDSLLNTKITDLNSLKNNTFINIDNLFEWKYTTSSKKNYDIDPISYIVIPVKINEPFTFIDSSNSKYVVSYKYYYMNNNNDDNMYIRQELDLFNLNNPTGTVVEIYTINNKVQTNACLLNSCIIDTSSGNSYKLSILRAPINLINSTTDTEYVSGIKNYPYGIIIRKIISVPVVLFIGETYTNVLSLFMNFSFSNINFINLSTVETKIENLIVIDIDPYPETILYTDYTTKYNLLIKPPLRVCLDDTINIYCNTFNEWIR